MKKLLKTVVCFFIISNINSQVITYSQDWQGNSIETDQYGNTKSTYSQDWQGNTVKKDQYGNIQGTYSKDWQGNTIYTPSPKY